MNMTRKETILVFKGTAAGSLRGKKKNSQTCSKGGEGEREGKVLFRPSETGKDGIGLLLYGKEFRKKPARSSLESTDRRSMEEGQIGNRVFPDGQERRTKEGVTPTTTGSSKPREAAKITQWIARPSPKPQALFADGKEKGRGRAFRTSLRGRGGKRSTARG